MKQAFKLDSGTRPAFLPKVQDLLPRGGNLNFCLTCGACASGCPATGPDEMVPLWKILHLAGADWIHSNQAWGGENYCMFLADDDNWKKIAAKHPETGRSAWLQGLSGYGMRAFHRFSLAGST